MTLPNTKELRELRERGTQGEFVTNPKREDGWLTTPQVCATSRTSGVFVKGGGGQFPSVDAELIAAAVNALIPLCDEVERLRDENAKLKQGAEILDKALAMHYCVNTPSHRCTACEAHQEYWEVVGE